ncbi:MAG: hypothetical protein NTY39_11500 [Campylobacterales bacterium]|nr:hypothetical protein [Campylobacterales bacterium]
MLKADEMVKNSNYGEFAAIKSQICFNSYQKVYSIDSVQLSGGQIENSEKLNEDAQ